MAYPSVVTNFTNPLPTNRLNSPSHSSIETAQNTGLTEIQTFVGTIASTAGTLIYDVRSPSSPGGGHIQGAVYGGTGQTTFNQGDIFVAQNSSTISKLAIGSQGQVLGVNSGSPVGISWSSVVANKIAITTTSVKYAIDTNSNIIFSASILGSTLGTNNAIRFTGRIPVLAAFTDITFIANYGNNVASSVVVLLPNPITSIRGELTGIIFSNGDTSQQISHMTFNGAQLRNILPLGSVLYATSTHPTTSSVNSSAYQDFNIQAKFAAANNLNSILAGPFVIEKIS